MTLKFVKDSPCLCIHLGTEHQNFLYPNCFRFDSHLLAEKRNESERFICTLTKLRSACVVVDKTTYMDQVNIPPLHA